MLMSPVSALICSLAAPLPTVPVAWDDPAPLLSLDLQRTEVGGDVALARGGIDLEARIGGQDQRDVAVLAGNHHLAHGQLVSRMNLDVAIGILDFDVARDTLQMNFLGARNQLHRPAHVGGPQSVAGNLQVARHRGQRNVGTRGLELHCLGDLAQPDVVEEVAIQPHRALHVLQRDIVNAAIDVDVASDVASANRALVHIDFRRTANLR